MAVRLANKSEMVRPAEISACISEGPLMSTWCFAVASWLINTAPSVALTCSMKKYPGPHQRKRIGGRQELQNHFGAGLNGSLTDGVPSPLGTMAVHGAMSGTSLQSTRLGSAAHLRVHSRSASRRQSNVSAVECSAQTLSRTYTGTQTAPPKSGQHFLHIDDFSKEELSAMLSTARTVKDRVLRSDNDYKPLAGKTMAMIFTKPSMRTRVSFETVSLRGVVAAHTLRTRGYLLTARDANASCSCFRASSN